MVFPFNKWLRGMLAAGLLILLPGISRGQASASSDAKPAGGVFTDSTNIIKIGHGETTAPGQGRLDRFEDELFGTHKPLDLGNSMNGIAPSDHRPPRTMLPLDPREKERIDKQRDWAFSIINDMNSTPTAEQILGMPEYGPDGRAKKKLAPMEQYYDNLNKAKLSNSNQWSDMMKAVWDVKQLSSTNALNPLVYTSMSGDKTMQNVMVLHALGQTDGNNLDADASPGDSSKAAEKMAAETAAAAQQDDQKRRFEDFKKMLNGDSGPAFKPYSFDQPESYKHPQSAEVLYGPVLSPAAAPTPAPAAALANQSSLNPVLGVMSPSGSALNAIAPGARVTPPPTTDFRSLLEQAPPKPKPALDPFTQNFPKRAF